MFYEIFKVSVDNGFSWFGFAFSLLASAYVLYALAWTSGWVLSRVYSYVQDGEASIPNFMVKAFDFLLKGSTGSYTGSLAELKEGWYETSKSVDALSDSWVYSYVRGGGTAERADNRADVEYKASESHYPNVTSGEIQEFPSLWLNARRSSSTKGLLYWLTPLVLSVAILFIDRAPLISVLLVSGYGVLRVARSAVRLGKKLTKHIDDKSAHGPTESTDPE